MPPGQKPAEGKAYLLVFAQEYLVQFADYGIDQFFHSGLSPLRV
ncbi:hypothetical protein KYE_00280 [Marinobacter manganoxydans MnI7-9]|uniref:Uncharacterized protein n=1 Tax=Marinobacter manganoxydans MnI7-9 TaxID=1094979 RepID=G6YMK6_9GAMM|nr:hypothetical protein KYE_00280 [Marinobacter manganoxydans MnI7-9]